MDHHTQLHVVGAVKALQLFVQDRRIGNGAGLKRYPGGHVILPGVLQPLQVHLPGLAFHQPNLHHAPVDALGRQIRFADQIAFLAVQFVDGAFYGIQILQ